MPTIYPFAKITVGAECVNAAGVPEGDERPYRILQVSVADDERDPKGYDLNSTFFLFLISDVDWRALVDLSANGPGQTNVSDFRVDVRAIVQGELAALSRKATL